VSDDYDYDMDSDELDPRPWEKRETPCEECGAYHMSNGQWDGDEWTAEEPKCEDCMETDRPVTSTASPGRRTRHHNMNPMRLPWRSYRVDFATDDELAPRARTFLAREAAERAAGLWVSGGCIGENRHAVLCSRGLPTEGYTPRAKLGVYGWVEIEGGRP